MILKRFALVILLLAITQLEASALHTVSAEEISNVDSHVYTFGSATIEMPILDVNLPPVQEVKNGCFTRLMTKISGFGKSAFNYMYENPRKIVAATALMIAAPLAIYEIFTTTRLEQGFPNGVASYFHTIFPSATAIVLPAQIDLFANFTKRELSAYNQEPLKACLSNALATSLRYLECVEGLTDCADESSAPSRLAIYYNARVIRGNINNDTGVNMYAGIQGLIQHGFCNERIWPYRVELLTIKPPPSCYQQARFGKYSKINTDIPSLKLALSKKSPVVMAIGVEENFVCELFMVSLPDRKIEDFWMIPMPTGKLNGNHAIVLFGYDNEVQAFLFRNSWGQEWGNNGNCMISYEYIIKHGFDAWAIEKIIR